MSALRPERAAAWLLVFALLPAVALAAPVPRLAVAGLKAQGGVDQKSVDLLTDLLVADLAAAKKWNVTSSAELATLLGVDREKQLTGCDDDDCKVELAQALGAEWVVNGSVGALGNLRVLTVTLFDSKKAVVARRETIEVADDGALAEGIHLLASRFTGVPLVRASSGVRKGWFVLGGGAVLALGGAGFGIGALDQYDQYKASPANTGLHSSSQTLGYFADGCFVAAIIAGVIGAAMLIFGGDDPR